MSKCLRCTYPKGGPRICHRCGTPAKGEVVGPAEAAMAAEKGYAAQPAVAAGTLITEEIVREMSGMPSKAQEMMARHVYEPGELPLREDLHVIGDNAGSPIAKLPEHSSRGASGAERWMECSGAPRLAEIVRKVGNFEEADPDYRVDGTNAHSIAAYCLDNDIDAWEASAIGKFAGMADVSMQLAVQVYLDYVRSRPGTRRVEQRFHRPDIHPLFYGTLDCEVTPPNPMTLGGELLEIIDYKNGAGVVVEVEENPQIMYYAASVVVGGSFLGSDRIRLTIVQPNAYHPDGPIRSWVCTAHELREWVANKLVPAIKETEGENVQFKLGSWCRFCPAKLACPAYDELARKVLKAETLTYAEAQQLKMLIKDAEQREFTALVNGDASTGGKLVLKKVDREWKPEAEAKIKEKYGDDAMQPPKLKSPAQVEALPGGKVIVAEWAFHPEGGLTVAPLSDKRSEVRPKVASEVFGAAVQRALDTE